MNKIPSCITNSSIWNNTLSSEQNDEFNDERGRLLNTFLNFRDRAAILASEIRKDLPDFTVHDISHIDSLWELSSIIIGENYSLTPTEGFVLGGAFLLHDLGMSLAALDGGLSRLKKSDRWNDLVTLEYQNCYNKNPTINEINNPEITIQNKVIAILLRQLHAENAEKLAFLSFCCGKEKENLFLIEDTEIRQTFGRIIGLIAHSHWWSIIEIEKEFSRIIGAPYWCPPEWKIDPLKLACILRVADAAHIDSKRAPIFLESITQLSSIAKQHWNFQQKLNKPYLTDDALVYTTGHAFNLSEAGAWWLCLENLRLIDRELRSVDSLFADKNYPRFSARRVAGIDTPERLVTYIQTDSWLPINATIHVSDLPTVIKSIGGEELYGKQPEIALRELIQNSTDAIKARRLYENRDAKYGNIIVALSKDKYETYWLEVLDDGIGMSERVLTDFLLDFGKTFWGSALMQEEFPGLLSSGIKPIGKYGIGFFSVFMLSDQIQVITRRADRALNDTLVLEFSTGLLGRPILRNAKNNERLIDGGTTIKLKLKKNPYKKDGFLYDQYRKKNNQMKLHELCLDLCPAIDVDLYIIENGKKEKIIGASDWLNIKGEEFLRRMRIHAYDETYTERELNKFRKKAKDNLRLIRDENGRIYGRAMITMGYAIHRSNIIDLDGVVTIGGLRACGLTGIIGVLDGVPIKASRIDAKPIIPEKDLKRWADEQADLVKNVWEEPEIQAACAQYIRMCGGDTKDLPICINKGKWLSANDIMGNKELPSRIILIDHMVLDYELRGLKKYELYDHVFITRTSGIPGLLQARARWPYNLETNFAWGGQMIENNLAGVVIESIAKSWGVSLNQIANFNSFNREREIVVGKTTDREITASALILNKLKIE